MLSSIERDVPYCVDKSSRISLSSRCQLRRSAARRAISPPPAPVSRETNRHGPRRASGVGELDLSKRRAGNTERWMVMIGKRSEVRDQGSGAGAMEFLQ